MGVQRVIVIARRPAGVARLLPLFTAAGMTVEAWSAAGSRLGYSRHVRRYGDLSEDRERRHQQLALLAADVSPSDWVVIGSEEDLWDIVDATTAHTEVEALLPLPAMQLAAVGSKIGMAHVLRECGVDQPRWTAVAVPGDLERAAAQIGYPVVVKSDRSGGGQGVIIAESSSELRGVDEGQGPWLVEAHEPGRLASIDLIVVDGRVAIAPYSVVLDSMRPLGVSLARTYGQLPAGPLARDLTRITERLGGSWFGNVSAIRRPDGSHAMFEVDLRPNVWHAYLPRLGYPVVPALTRMRLGEPVGAVGDRPSRRTRFANVTRALQGAIAIDPRLALAVVDHPRSWILAHRGDPRLSYREARDLARWLILTRGGRRRW